MDNNTPKIYERNPDTGVIRWRYVGEPTSKYGWPHYGNILTPTPAPTPFPTSAPAPTPI